MGLLQKAYETYCAMDDEYAGKYIAGQKEPLAPICHGITAAQIEISISEDGGFISASAVGKDEPKIIVPMSEQSANRSGKKAYESPHPLCDKLTYLTAADNYYIPQLEKWANSDHSHEKVRAILKYVKGRSIIADLDKYGLIKYDKDGNPQNTDDLVRWRVISPEPENVPECWIDLSLFDSYKAFCLSEYESKNIMCMVTGEIAPAGRKHAKGVVSVNGNAKLISSNDETGFTYRGRFTEDSQAASVSYEASQKAHNALRWVIANQGYLIGGRAFICWNPKGIRLADPKSPMLRSGGKVYIKASDYADELRRTLNGYKESLPDSADAIIASFDAATTGRLALTYYNELRASDLLDRLHDWDKSCCWWNGRYGIQSPPLARIVECAYGTQRVEKQKPKLAVDDRVFAQQFQRLFACRLDKAKIPQDIIVSLMNRASSPLSYDTSVWEKILFTACAVIQRNKEELCMDWKLDKPDRSFQFGRLLAVMERAENDYYYQTGETRVTNAIKSMSQFRRTPLTVTERVNCTLETAYLPRCNKWCADRYRRLRDEIIGNLSIFDESELNKPLDENYLIGYSIQRNTFYNHNNTETEEE